MRKLKISNRNLKKVFIFLILKQVLKNQTGDTMNIYIMGGPPGSGKSTWIKYFIRKNLQNTTSAIISRDEVRFSLLKDDDAYFSKEDRVFKLWIKKAQEAIDSNIQHIFLDATHLTPKSRFKVYYQLKIPSGARLIGVNMMTPPYRCWLRNRDREGRERVPDDVIEKMCEAFAPMDTDNNNDRHLYDFTISVYEDYSIKIRKNGKDWSWDEWRELYT